MRRPLLPAALALVVLTGGVGFAQQPQEQGPPPPPSAQGMHHERGHNPHREALRLQRALGLTPDQTAQVEPILAARHEKEKALFANQQLTPDVRHEQMKAIHMDAKAQLDAVLTPDQREKLKAMHQGERERHGQGAPMAPPSGM